MLYLYLAVGIVNILLSNYSSAVNITQSKYDKLPKIIIHVHICNSGKTKCWKMWPNYLTCLGDIDVTNQSIPILYVTLVSF